MNYRRLETFIWVATLGSFNRAAERLHTTQPAISTRMATLENELGVRLFNREQGAGKLSLTAKGTELLPYAEKIVFMSEQMRKRADQAAQFSGTLRLGVSETIVHTWLSKFLSRLHHELPNIDAEITVDVTGQLSEQLLNRSLDLAFLMGPVSDPTIANMPLSKYPLAWVASPELNLPDRLMYLEEISAWPIITYARNTKPFVEIQQRFREVDTLPAKFFSSSSLAACLKLTLDSVGLSTLPVAMIAGELERGELKRVKATWTPSELVFTASYPVEPYTPIAEVAANIAVQVAADNEL